MSFKDAGSGSMIMMHVNNWDTCQCPDGVIVWSHKAPGAPYYLAWTDDKRWGDFLPKNWEFICV